MSNLLKQTAEKVVDNVAGDKREFDVTMIILIMELLMEFLPKLMELCNEDPETIVAKARKPKWRHKRVLRLQTRRTLGRRGYAEKGREVADAVTKTGAESTPAEITELYADIQRKKEENLYL